MIEIWRVVVRQSVREGLVVHELDLVLRVLKQLPVQVGCVGHGPFEVASVVCRLEQKRARAVQVLRVVDAILVYDRILPTRPADVVWQNSNVHELRVVLAMVVQECHVIRAAFTPRHTRCVRLRNKIIACEPCHGTMVRLAAENTSSTDEGTERDVELVRKVASMGASLCDHGLRVNVQPWQSNQLLILVGISKARTILMPLGLGVCSRRHNRRRSVAQLLCEPCIMAHCRHRYYIA
mmetsp:Transcript_45563/g.114839  ORF Transcript_45563/g.114839 Transcript_45563/m.114839 type:complete len:237 (+) Transcript_45563:475-1185(+)